jgi:hypothetical protein
MCSSTSFLQSITADTFNKVVLASVALVSLIAGPVVQWKIAKRQAKLQEEIAKRQAADNISTKRQVWIDELRKEVAEYLTLIARLEELRRPNESNSEDDQKRTFDELMDATKRATELGIRIKLRLNPKEAEHNEFVRLLNALATACKDPTPNETEAERKNAQNEFFAARDKVIAHVQTILKHEWERVKRGDL